MSERVREAREGTGRKWLSSTQVENLEGPGQCGDVWHVVRLQIDVKACKQGRNLALSIEAGFPNTSAESEIAQLKGKGMRECQVVRHGEGPVVQMLRVCKEG